MSGLAVLCCVGGIFGLVFLSMIFGVVRKATGGGVRTYGGRGYQRPPSYGYGGGSYNKPKSFGFGGGGGGYNKPKSFGGPKWSGGGGKKSGGGAKSKW